MQMIGEHELAERLGWPELIGAIETELKAGRVTSPERSNIAIPMPGGGTSNLLVMPAWVEGESLGVKLVTFFPENGEKGLSTINASYALFSGADGRLQAVIEGDELTARRTAAASALAARFLARKDARRLLVVGTGQLSAKVAAAHASVRSYERIEIYGRSSEKAEAVVAALAGEGVTAHVARDLDAAVAAADVISSVTSSTAPLIRGALVKPGTHVDLIGAFKDDMRESDDALVTKASLFVDFRPGAMKAGDLAQPLAAGLISEADIRADLGELATGKHSGRASDEEITFFKSAGFSLLDLAAARLAVGQG
ncbi:ornithine cyclodeaminase family protein [Aliihoeflea sp. 2WW]|uniref:ornithine cyclodeaminase family protein n=1 Tax=Aliihoeflea sp. 2WW TaxID=1381123 RepID=UPI00046748F0|nr:ornithine cyclodeaminase family protein [Aliihoeflea sp. 2WW]